MSTIEHHNVYELIAALRNAEPHSKTPDLLEEAAYRLEMIVGIGDAQIKRMVDRFLQWPLPADFSPDGGTVFTPIVGHHPVGTNLFTATQAEAMVRHMFDAQKEQSDE